MLQSLDNTVNRQALSKLGINRDRILQQLDQLAQIGAIDGGGSQPVRAFVELHAEQGPVLELLNLAG